MTKSKEFIVERSGSSLLYGKSVFIKYLRGGIAGYDLNAYCYGAFSRFFGIKLKPGEKKRIKITIEEV